MPQQTDVHERITKHNRNNINDPQKKHRLVTVSKDIILEDLNPMVTPSSHQRRFDGALKRRAKRHQSVTKLD